MTTPLTQVNQILTEEFDLLLQGIAMCSQEEGCSMLAACEVRQARENILRRLNLLNDQKSLAVVKAAKKARVWLDDRPLRCGPLLDALDYLSKED